jgi:Kef-type K+ transport system membrane component KefB
MASEQIALLLIELAAILCFCGLMRAFAVKLRQPPVIGELLGGVLLGPAVLGSWSHVVVPDVIRPELTAFGNIGVALFMLALGTEFRLDSGGPMRRAGAIAAGAMAMPFVAGIGAALLLAGTGLVRPARVVDFVLFMGVAMAITAFPVLARILADQGLTGTGLGKLAMAVAAVCDVLAWTALAVVITIASSGQAQPWRVLLVVPLVLVLRFAVRRLRAWSSTVIVGGGLASSAVTELIGLHFVFGAFLFGLVVPHTHGAALRERVLAVSRLFLPIYFVVAGLQVDTSFDGRALALLGIVICTAVAGKLVGTYVAARCCHLGPRPASTLAVLMNTRGLTELIVLTTGLQLGLIGRDLYSVMVVMALLTTMMTGPVLNALHRRWQVTNPVAFALDEAVA